MRNARGLRQQRTTATSGQPGPASAAAVGKNSKNEWVPNFCHKRGDWAATASSPTLCLQANFHQNAFCSGLLLLLLQTLAVEVSSFDMNVQQYSEKAPATSIYTVGVNKNWTFVIVNFSAQDASILKIFVAIFNRRSWGFQNTPGLQSLDDFEPSYGTLKKNESSPKFWSYSINFKIQVNL